MVDNGGHISCYVRGSWGLKATTEYVTRQGHARQISKTKGEGTSKRKVARVSWAEARRRDRKDRKGQVVALKRALGVLIAIYGVGYPRPRLETFWASSAPRGVCGP